MSLQIVCCECKKVISNGMIGDLPLEEDDVKDFVFSIGKIKGYTGLIRTTNMETDTDYPEPLLCGECVRNKLPNINKIYSKIGE